jgi:hypothetical protein
MNELQVKNDDTNWVKLFKTGSISAMLIALLMVGEIFVYALIPNSDNPIEIFELFQRNAFAGLLFFDLLGIISYLLFIPFMISLYKVMEKENPVLLSVGTILFFIGITVFIANNTGLSVLSLSNQYKAATSEEEKAMLMAACKTMITLFDVNAFMVSYVIVSLAWSMISYAMVRSKIFSRSTAYFGLLAGLSGIIAEIIENTMKQFLMVAISFYFLAIVFLIIWLVKSGLLLYKIGFHGRVNSD